GGIMEASSGKSMRYALRQEECAWRGKRGAVNGERIKCKRCGTRGALNVLVSGERV
ncbi:hypothetical protein CSUI_009540, partial [Cystoisospora suis]